MLCHNLILSLSSMLEHTRLCHHFKGKEISAQRCEALGPHVCPWGSVFACLISFFSFLPSFISLLLKGIDSLEAQTQRIISLGIEYVNGCYLNAVFLFDSKPKKQSAWNVPSCCADYVDPCLFSSSEKPKALIESATVHRCGWGVGRCRASRGLKCAWRRWG